MARTSKKIQADGKVAGTQQQPKIYSVGIYARLSVDGSDRKNESMETQVEIAKAFIRQQKDMTLFACYTDIGKTGTNFEREGFERLMRDVRTGKIDCIIVKDLSRFGRNHIETGNFIEKIFPFLGVRFIAVTDDFDSLYVSAENDTLDVNLKNLVNEMYARDIARKVKSGRKTKWEQGSYTGGVPPYGYMAEWIGNKKCLLVEETTSDIVKKIYELFLLGKNKREIVQWLYEKKIVRPTEYHKTGQIYSREENFLQWSGGTVKMILTNPVYMGCLVQGRTCGKDYMMRDRHDLSTGDWSVKERTHEAIISEEIFFEAAAKFEKSSVYCNKNAYFKAIPSDEDIFANVLFCGECGAKMKRISAIKTFQSKDKVRIYSYHCPKNDRVDNQKCVTKNISLHSLANIIKTAIRQEFALSEMSKKELLKRNHLEAKQLKGEWNKQLAELDRKMENITKLGSEQYMKYRMGVMNQKSFQSVKEDNDKKMLSLQAKQIALLEKLRVIDTQTVENNHFFRTLVKGSEKTELTTEVIRTLIDRILVYPDYRVKIIFAFKRNNMLLRGEDI